MSSIDKILNKIVYLKRHVTFGLCKGEGEMMIYMLIKFRLLADVSLLFSDVALVFADQSELQPDFAHVQPDESDLLADFSLVFAHVANLFADIAGVHSDKSHVQGTVDGNIGGFHAVESEVLCGYILEKVDTE